TAGALDPSGVIAGDTVTIASADAKFNSKDVLGASTIVVTYTLSNANYSLADGTFDNASITPKVISLDGSRGYDGTTAAAASAFGGPIATGVGVETLTLSGQGSVASKNVSAGT